jgi:Fe-S-cluster containining protein
MFDIARIAEHTRLKPSDFVQLVSEPEERERKEPAILINGKYYLLVLKWSAKFNCFFYDKSGCKIYKFRPMLCRSYPFYCTIKSTIKFLKSTDFNSFCLKGKQLQGMKSRACPSLWMPENSEKSKYLSDIKQYEKEVQIYSKVVKKWNKTGGGTFDEFLVFLLYHKKYNKIFEI